MGKNIVQKIFNEHLVQGKLAPGEEIAVTVDQTLTQDATGTMAYLQFEAMAIPRVKTKVSVSYVDHNMLQTGFENADDHRYLQSVALKVGAFFSRPGNGICHQVHLERFSAPGQILLGSDSHTPTCGGAGMIAIGAGGLDIAVAMAGGAFHLKCPNVVGVRLEGRLTGWTSAKDVILELLRRLTVKGGVGKIFAYHGPGVKSLDVTQRATITNMGAELGATTSIFPSDERTRDFLEAQGRGQLWREMLPDEDAAYDELVVIDLSKLEPLVAMPHSPDAVVPLKDVAGTKIQQVCVGSCTNSSYHDLMVVAQILKGKKAHPELSFAVTPGSRQVFEMIADSGGLKELIASGARILESACGPCIGMGQVPPTGSLSLRSFNRNFKGRCGSKEAGVILASPEICALGALEGVLPDVSRYPGGPPEVAPPRRFIIDDGMIIPPAAPGEEVEVVRGPNIKPCPVNQNLPDSIEGKVLLVTGDNITTDDIMPAGSKVLPLRSNIPKISEHVFSNLDPEFPARARQHKGGIIIGGNNYGQGSSREHAAIAPMYLGLKAVISKSFARIHRSNLINFGILPAVFASESDYAGVAQGDELALEGIHAALQSGDGAMTVTNKSKGTKFKVVAKLSDYEREVILAGGLLPFTKLKA
ncbi:MAG: aconitate hydratase [Candidatus Glassbacteria bacterium RIFCSPLOWO2_12_FULL_58_11]|uniref:Aconitate hydratase n=1 Tax=Candidatus Glassbacteria bacterium RIFCSPLOWO2_12_FULL_58_11 TaxID=1817867 RepID=A0A1F5YKW3_9BACT|nr:MAG: aconitate hydratase [Candidatus Glassbacteria bacterium RIFCSPLOWO2_12_FULL_58_11]